MSRIPAQRAPFVNLQTGEVNREWYLFLADLVNINQLPVFIDQSGALQPPSPGGDGSGILPAATTDGNVLSDLQALEVQNQSSPPTEFHDVLAWLTPE